MGAISVYFHRAALPSVSQWNDALHAEGFDLVMDPFDLEENDGYRAGIMCGGEVAFEWDLYSVDLTREDEEVASVVLPIIGGRDAEAQLHCTQEAEEVASQIAGAVLAKITNGYYWDREQSGITLLPGTEALAIAKKALSNWKEQGSNFP